MTKCLYEILEVSKDADETQIKKSYRSLALKWHPDKNIDNTEACTRKFQTIQYAYSVLGDPTKKLLYDNGDSGYVLIHNYDENENDWDRYKPTHNHYHKNHRKCKYPRKPDIHNPFKYEKIKIDLWSKFNTNWFHGYSDKPDGFYTMCRKLFERLSLEAKDPDDCPTFGYSNSDFDTTVRSFYVYWIKKFDVYVTEVSEEYEADMRTGTVRYFAEYIKTIDKRAQRYAELCSKECEKHNSKYLKSIKNARGPCSSGRPQSDYCTYNGSANALLHEIDGDSSDGNYSDIDYENDEYDYE